MIDTWGVNPLETSEKEWKEAHKRQRSVTGERRSEGGEDAETEEEEVEELFFGRTAVVLETQPKPIL